MSAAIPTTPLVPVLVYEQPINTIPYEAKVLYEQRWCSPLEASDFLGFKRKTNARTGKDQAANAVYERMARYRDRVAPVLEHPPYDPDELLPRAGEIAAQDNGAGWQVNTRMLVRLVYPQVSPW